MTITILGIPYRIEEVDIVNKYDPADGEIDYENCVIKIDKHLPTSLKNQVLMHEVMHGILILLGYMEDAKDEQKVQGLATALHMLFSSGEQLFFEDGENNVKNH